jgi:hypothetical protein
MGGSVQVLLLKSIAIAAFSGVSVLCFKRNLWLVVGALVAHGTFDTDAIQTPLPSYIAN